MVRPKNLFNSVAWIVWFVPIVAIAICGWLFYDYFKSRGPIVEIKFMDASALEAKKTPLKYRGLNVGLVEEISLAPSRKQVIVKARVYPDFKNLAVEGTQFSIIQPKVDFSGISGLETLIKGTYIRLDPGKGAPKKEFVGNKEAEVNETTASTVSYTLRTNFNDSAGPGDSVTFRGLKVGSVSAVKLSATAQWIDIEVSIEKKYVKLVRKNTVFWNKVGVQANLGLFGSEVKINSFESLMRGGIAFATPDEALPIADAGTRFDLAPKPPKDYEKWAPKL